ncbi:MAG: glycosyltransferase family 2 protein [Alphaproteobacteria bacterium]|nr:glycosyltransferase family 2 protein [Alphaproteobacteria bacterium]
MYAQVNYVREDDQHVLLDLLVPFLRVGPDIRRVRFKVMSSPKWFGLEFRKFEEAQQPFSAWPGTESDKFGAKFILGVGAGLEKALANVRAEDLQFLACLIRALPQILEDGLKAVQISDAARQQLLRGVHQFLALDKLRDLASTYSDPDVVGQRNDIAGLTNIVLGAKTLSRAPQNDVREGRNFLPPNLPEFFKALHSERLRFVSSARDPIPGNTDPILISVVRNEMALIGEYFEHYRRAGIRRFVIIDNDSTDGTLEYVSSQPDTDVYSHADQFSTAGKQGWINRIILRYGHARWYLIADADEHIVFDGIESHGFGDLVQRLESQGRRLARGMLIDMYGDRPLSQLPGACDNLRLQHRFFDKGPYAEVRRTEMMSCRGGVRRRVFSRLDAEFDPELTKYPLLKLDREEYFASPHYVWPPSPHLADPCLLGILHYKFTENLSQKAADAVARKQYWNQSAEYSVYEAAFARTPELVLKSAESAEYEDSKSISSLGLIQPIHW